MPEEQIRPLLERVRAATSEADIKAAAGRVETLGLPALPHVQRFLAGLPKDHPARGQVQAMTERLSCVVAEVTLAKGSVALDAPLAEKLAGLQGKPLSADRYVSVLLHMALTPPQGATGIRLKAVREDDLTGVTLFVNLVTTAAEQEGSGGGYSTAQRVVVGSEGLLGSFGTRAPGWARNVESYEELRRAIEKALASAPDVPFVISSSLIGEK